MPTSHEERIRTAFTRQAPTFEEARLNIAFTSSVPWLLDHLTPKRTTSPWTWPAGPASSAEPGAACRLVVAVDSTPAMIDQGLRVLCRRPTRQSWTAGRKPGCARTSWHARPDPGSVRSACAGAGPSSAPPVAPSPPRRKRRSPHRHPTIPVPVVTPRGFDAFQPVSSCTSHLDSDGTHCFDRHTG